VLLGGFGAVLAGAPRLYLTGASLLVKKGSGKSQSRSAVRAKNQTLVETNGKKIQWRKGEYNCDFSISIFVMYLCSAFLFCVPQDTFIVVKNNNLDLFHLNMNFLNEPCIKIYFILKIWYCIEVLLSKTTVYYSNVL